MYKLFKHWRGPVKRTELAKCQQYALLKHIMCAVAVTYIYIYIRVCVCVCVCARACVLLHGFEAGFFSSVFVDTIMNQQLR
jgi:hypothetical protein